MILIIGGMGFIGLNTALRFLEIGQRVVLSQHSARRIPDVLKSEIGTRVMIAQMDVTNPYEVFEVVRRHQVESIVNLMAPPARSLSTQADYHLYTAGLQNVLEAARTFGLRRVSLGSSVGVYGGIPHGPYRRRADHEPVPDPPRTTRRTRRCGRPDIATPPRGRIRGLVRRSRPVQPAARRATTRPTRTSSRIRDQHRPRSDRPRTPMTSAGSVGFAASTLPENGAGGQPGDASTLRRRNQRCVHQCPQEEG